MEHEQIRTAREKMKHCLIFSQEIFYVTIVFTARSSYASAVLEIVIRYVRLSIRHTPAL